MSKKKKPVPAPVLPKKREVVIKIRMSAEARKAFMPKASEPEKNKGGRPRLSDSSVSVTLGVRLPMDLKESLQNRCEDEGLVAAEVIRDLIKEWVESA